MKRIKVHILLSLMIVLIIPSIVEGVFNDHDGNCVAEWTAPVVGNQVSHYLAKYNINGVIDSIVVETQALTDSVLLSNLGDWTVLSLEAISINGDTSIVVVSDTAVYDVESIGPPGGIIWKQ